MGGGGVDGGVGRELSLVGGRWRLLATSATAEQWSRPSRANWAEVGGAIGRAAEAAASSVATAARSVPSASAPLRGAAAEAVNRTTEAWECPAGGARPVSRAAPRAASASSNTTVITIPTTSLSSSCTAAVARRSALGLALAAATALATPA